MDELSTIEEMVNMPLNTTVIYYDGAMKITRVPGGWIYKFTEFARYGINFTTNIECVFVP